MNKYAYLYSLPDINTWQFHTILGILLVLGCETPSYDNETFAGVY